MCLLFEVQGTPEPVRMKHESLAFLQMCSGEEERIKGKELIKGMRFNPLRVKTQNLKLKRFNCCVFRVFITDVEDSSSFVRFNN